MTENMTKSNRLFFIDNIRWLMIVFVILTHAAVTYSNMGSWYYTEPVKLDIVSLAVFGIFQSFTQAYFMGLLFLIAGYFTPGAFDRKSFAKFIGDRLVRLGIPTMIYMLFINPIIVYYMLAFRWKELQPPMGQAFLGYILSLDFLSGSGPMWFALALLIFSFVYAATRLFRRDSVMSQQARQAQQDGSYGDLPRHLDMVKLGLIISVFAFAIRLVQPIGTSVMNMQLGFFSQYVILFIVGIIAYRQNWMTRIPHSFGVTWFRIALIGGSIFWLAIQILGGGISGDFSSYSGGLHWQSAAYAFWESFFCLGVSLGLIVIFRERFNWQSRFTKFMSDNYFSVYVFHAPILISVSLAFREFSWHPLLKFIVVGSISVLLCFLASHFVLRRIPLLKNIL